MNRLGNRFIGVIVYYIKIVFYLVKIDYFFIVFRKVCGVVKGNRRDFFVYGL